MTVKAARYLAERDIPLTPYYRVVWFFHDYGILLAAVILGWAAFCAFHSTIFSRRNVDERGIVASGLALSGLFFVLAIFLTFAGDGRPFRFTGMTLRRAPALNLPNQLTVLRLGMCGSAHHFHVLHVALRRDGRLLHLRHREPDRLGRRAPSPAGITWSPTWASCSTRWPTRCWSSARCWRWWSGTSRRCGWSPSSWRGNSSSAASARSPPASARSSPRKGGQAQDRLADRRHPGLAQLAEPGRIRPAGHAGGARTGRGAALALLDRAPHHRPIPAPSTL